MPFPRRCSGKGKWMTSSRQSTKLTNVGIGSVLDTTLPDNEPDDLRRIHFLRRLRTRVAEIPAKQARLLAVAMAERTLGMLSDHIAYQVLKGDVLALAAHFQGTPKLQEVLAEVVQAAGSDMFASDIVYSSVSAREKADEITNWNGFDAEEIKKAFGLIGCAPPSETSLEHAAFGRGIIHCRSADGEYTFPRTCRTCRTISRQPLISVPRIWESSCSGSCRVMSVTRAAPSSSSRVFTLLHPTSSRDLRKLSRMA